MTIDWNRTLSLILALAYLAIAAVTGGGRLFFQVLVFLILPLACIWFGEAMGSVAGPASSLLSGGPAITKSSPGCVVVFAGWLLLFTPIVVAIIQAFHG